MVAPGMRQIPGTPSYQAQCEHVLVRVVASFGPNMASEAISGHLRFLGGRERGGMPPDLVADWFWSCAPPPNLKYFQPPMGSGLWDRLFLDQQGGEA